VRTTVNIYKSYGAAMYVCFECSFQGTIPPPSPPLAHCCFAALKNIDKIADEERSDSVS
jgi:hypothetical protein